MTNFTALLSLASSHFTHYKSFQDSFCLFSQVTQETKRSLTNSSESLLEACSEMYVRDVVK